MDLGKHYLNNEELICNPKSKNMPKRRLKAYFFFQPIFLFPYVSQRGLLCDAPHLVWWPCYTSYTS